jgi:hypothetical protein
MLSSWPRRRAPGAPGSAPRDGVQRGQALDPRHRHQEVAPGVADQPLHLALVVALARPAEAVGEEEVRLQLGERPGALARAVAEDARDREAGVVVEHAPRHAAEEGERRVVPVAERLCRLGRIGLHEAGVRVRQVEAEEVDLPLLAPDHRGRLAEVGLPVPGRVDQGHEQKLGCVSFPNTGILRGLFR